MRNTILTLIGVVWLGFAAFAQSVPFNIYLEPLNVPGLTGLQAYAFGQHNGKWLIAGGRLDGLHRRQPFVAFDTAGNNDHLIVIDPITLQTWSAPVTSLPVGISEQLSSTNMEFHQEGDFLYIVGGYGYNLATNSRISFENLTAINVPAVIDAVISGTSLIPHFRQITDAQFAVTGGHLKKINNTFYLLGGNRFDGNYNPMGNPTYVQTYTNEIRKFNISDDGVNISVTHLQGILDAANLHRRDYNAVSQILPDGAEGITMFSGVFQVGVDLPFLNCVNVDSSAHFVNNTFQQYYNHYHCAVLPLYSNLNNEMHNVFFGGIAQYYDSIGILVQDNNVPFVRTIARVSRDSTGIMSEYKLPVEMPGFLGAGSEFILKHDVPHSANEVVKLDDLATDTNLVGYIYGGINSAAANIFFSNTGIQSIADNQIFKVYVVKSPSTAIHQLNPQSMGRLGLQVLPNPNIGEFLIKFHLEKRSDVKIFLYTIDGQRIVEKILSNLSPGENTHRCSVQNLEAGGTFMLTIETAESKATQKIIVNP
jgi:hypothetical protein